MKRASLSDNSISLSLRRSLRLSFFSKFLNQSPRPCLALRYPSLHLFQVPPSRWWSVIPNLSSAILPPLPSPALCLYSLSLRHDITSFFFIFCLSCYDVHFLVFLFSPSFSTALGVIVISCYSASPVCGFSLPDCLVLCAFSLCRCVCLCVHVQTAPCVACLSSAPTDGSLAG